MKRPWFKCRPVDETFFSEAPVRLVGTFEIDKPAAEVWDDMCAEHPLSWCRILGESISWTSPKPFGVGTTRSAGALKGLGEIHEHYFLWEEGKRQSFYALEAGAPLFRRFAEDYIVEPLGENRCRLTWTVAYEPTLLGKGPVNEAILKTMFTDTRKHYGSA